MTHTLLIRAGEQLRDATATEVLDQATSLIASRFRPGTRVLTETVLTRQCRDRMCRCDRGRTARVGRVAAEGSSCAPGDVM
jgi:hypothetical protein